MNEEEIKEQLAKLPDEELDQLGKTLKGWSNSNDGLAALAGILALSDNAFDILKPVLMDEIKATLNSPDGRITLAQTLITENIHMEDIITDMDKIVEAFQTEMELSQSKIEFIKFLFTETYNALEESKAVPHRIINIPVEICREDAQLPKYATNGSAAMDIYSPDEYIIKPGETKIIPTGLKVNIPIGYALLIQPRSGMSVKTKARIPNSPGLIDSDYHEEIGVIIENISPKINDVDIYEPSDHFGLVKDYGTDLIIGKGERFAQMRLIEVPIVKWNEVESIGNFEADHGDGFGSTGVK